MTSFQFLPFFFLVVLCTFASKRRLDPSSDLFQELKDALATQSIVEFELESGIYRRNQSNSIDFIRLLPQTFVSIYSNESAVVEFPLSFDGDGDSVVVLSGISFGKNNFASSFSVNLNGPSLNLSDCTFNLEVKASLNVSKSKWVWVNGSVFRGQGNYMRINDVGIVLFDHSKFIDINDRPNALNGLNYATISGSGEKISVEDCVFTNITYTLNSAKTFSSIFYINGNYSILYFGSNLVNNLRTESINVEVVDSYLSLFRFEANFTEIRLYGNQIDGIYTEAIFLFSKLNGRKILVDSNNVYHSRVSLISFNQLKFSPYVFDIIEFNSNSFLNVSGSILEGNLNSDLYVVGKIMMKNTNCTTCISKRLRGKTPGPIITMFSTLERSFIMDSFFVDCIKIVDITNDMTFYRVTFDGNEVDPRIASIGSLSADNYLISFIQSIKIKKSAIGFELQDCTFTNLKNDITVITMVRGLWYLQSCSLIVNNTSVENSNMNLFFNSRLDRVVFNNLTWSNNLGRCLSSTRGILASISNSFFYNSSSFIPLLDYSTIINSDRTLIENTRFDSCEHLISFAETLMVNNMSTTNQRGIIISSSYGGNATISNSNFQVKNSIAFVAVFTNTFNITNSNVLNQNSVLIHVGQDPFNMERTIESTVMMDGCSIFDLTMTTEQDCSILVHLNRIKVEQYVSSVNLPDSLREIELEDSLFKGGISPRFLSGKPFLEQIYLRNISIEELEFDSVFYLMEMRVLNCSLKSIKGNHVFPQLEVLSLRENQLSTLDLELFNSTSMILLDLSNNGFVGSLSSFVGRENKLKHLDISNNSFDSYHSNVPDDILVCRTLGNVFRCPVDSVFFERCNVTCLWNNDTLHFYLFTLNTTGEVINALSQISNTRMDRFKVLKTSNHFAVNPALSKENQAISSDVVSFIDGRSNEDWESLGIRFISFSLNANPEDSEASSTNADHIINNVSVSKSVSFVVTLGVVLIFLVIIIIAVLVAFLIVSFKSKKEEMAVEMGSMTMIENVVITKRIGGGFFGEVFVGVWNETTEVAVKKINKDDKSLWEAQILRELNHPNVVDFFGMHKAGKDLYIIMEFCPLGSLDNWIIEFSEITSPSSAFLLHISIDIAKGMQYLNSQGILHRDLSSRNVLVVHDGQRYSMRVTDFGMSRKTDEYTHDPETVILPYKWVAPEVMKTNKWTQFSDVWSYGICLWELYSIGMPPYDDLTNKEAVNIILTKGCTLEQPTMCPDDVWAIMLNCWLMDPNLRHTFDSIVFKLGNIELGR
eukprot:TRINITY_DN3509_c0_g1_i3.p1 TRINITY_DN3509_c0_g1~~TRINITY_DN3509_c0_g1_i3.p1  ORF type:complete len:1275 (+),score=280.88 TRINITY_DN3509_c0_g1_i3:74-3898(+)